MSGEATYPVETKNVQIWHMYQAYQIWLFEVAASISRQTPDIQTPEVIRWESYNTGMVNIMDTFASMPEPDWPAIRRSYTLTEPLYPVWKFKENLGVQTYIDMVVNARDQLALCDSHYKPMHLVSHDEKRQRDYLKDMTTWINSFLKVTTPLDEPIAATVDTLLDTKVPT